MLNLGTAENEMFKAVIVNGIFKGWTSPSGTFYPAIAGGEGADDASGNGDGKDGNDKPDADDKKGSSPDDEPFDKDRAMRTINTLREKEREGKQHAARVKELESKLAEYEQKDMTEKEKSEARAKKAEEEREAARAELIKVRSERAIERAASKLSLDPELALVLLKPESLEVDDKGEPKGVEDALKALVEKWPNLKVNSSVKPPDINAKNGNKPTDGDKALDDAAKQELASIYGINPKYLP
jgi:hypothetical protein